MHNFKLGDEVYYPCDRSPFMVVGIRKDSVEIEGDFSGGTHCVCQKDWVKPSELQPYDKSKVKIYKTLNTIY